MCELKMSVLKKKVCVLLVLFSIGFIYSVKAQDYVETYELFDTPTGLSPIHCWYGVGQSPDGLVYIAGSDHKTNSALYQFNPVTKKLKYCGDAVKAATEAGNLGFNETFEKFHCRPTYIDGKVYVASTNYSKFNDGYKEERGYHWFAYDVAQDTFIDVSAVESNGVAAKKVQSVQILADTVRKKVFAMGIPTANIYELDITTGLTKDFGTPTFDFPDEYPEITSYPWIGADGKLYFTLDAPSLDPIYRHVYYLDPETGLYGEKTNWKLTVGRWNPSEYYTQHTPYRLKIGAWNNDGSMCYMSTNFGDIHLYDAVKDTFSYVGTLDWGGYYADNATKNNYQIYTRTMHLSSDESMIYFVNDKKTGDEDYLILEFDLQTKKTKALVNTLDLGSEFNERDRHGGNDIWDVEGCFYFVSFTWASDKGNTTITRFNPENYKLANNIPVEEETTTLSIVDNELKNSLCFPNPFSASTTFTYEVKQANNVSLRVFSTSGQEVDVLVDEFRTTGVYTLSWQPNLPAGTYIYQLQIGANKSEIETGKLILKK